MNFLDSIQDESFDELCLDSGFEVILKKTTKLKGNPVTLCKVRYQHHIMNFLYFHCDWRDALEILTKMHRPIDLIVAYDAGGEGGSNFVLALDDTRPEYELLFYATADPNIMLTRDDVFTFKGKIIKVGIYDTTKN